MFFMRLDFARRSILGRRIGVSLLSALAALVLAELLVRVFVGAPERHHVEVLAASAAALGQRTESGVLVMERRPPLTLYVMTATGMRLRPGALARTENHRLGGRDVEVRTNSRGFRGPELGPKERPRVLFLGDSITMAHYLHEEETFVRRVEQLSEATDRPLETVNAGVGAIGLENEVAILKEAGLFVEPDVVVLGFYLNDVAPSRSVAIPEPPGLLAWSALAGYLARAISPADEPPDRAGERSARRQWKRRMVERWPPGPGDPLEDPAAFHALCQEKVADWGAGWSEEAWAALEPHFRELKELAELHGFRLLFVCHPVVHQVEAGFLEDWPQRRLAELAAELEVPCLDLLPALRAAFAARGEALFYDQCHHTPRGSEVVAEAMHAFLEEQLAGAGN